MTSTKHLTAGQRAWLEADLQARLAQADARSAEHRGGLPISEHAREILLEDADDVSRRESSRSVDQAVTDRDRIVLGELADALRRVHDADFGLCRDCGEQIAFDRLKVEPWARRCVACQARSERVETAPRR